MTRNLTYATHRPTRPPPSKLKSFHTASDPAAPLHPDWVDSPSSFSVRANWAAEKPSTSPPPKQLQQAAPAGSSSRQLQQAAPTGSSSRQLQQAAPASSSSKQLQQAAPASSSSRQLQQAAPAGSSSRQLQQAAPASSHTRGSSTTPRPQLATTQATLPGRDVQPGPPQVYADEVIFTQILDALHKVHAQLLCNPASPASGEPFGLNTQKTRRGTSWL